MTSLTSEVIRVPCSVYEGLIYLLMSRHEVHGYEKLVSFGLKPMLYIFKRLSTEQEYPTEPLDRKPTRQAAIALTGKYYH